MRKQFVNVPTGKAPTSPSAMQACCSVFQKYILEFEIAISTFELSRQVVAHYDGICIADPPKMKIIGT
jgi:hypothetical protein